MIDILLLFLSVDYHTCKSLELVSNNGDSRSMNCLFGVICKCQSPMGRKFYKIESDLVLFIFILYVDYYLYLIYRKITENKYSTTID